ncbi:MAG: MerR family transcriptional regulator [Longimicrobiales bacterium]
MSGAEIRVGALADRTGLTVRTLHHWEAVGVLTPSRRTATGHRLYGLDAIGKILRIRSLRGLGLGLDEIRKVLGSGAATLEEVLRIQKAEINSQIHLLQELESRLDRLLERAKGGEEMEEEELLRTMEIMTLIEQHFTAEQLKILSAREKSLGREAILEAQREWPLLISRVREELQKGTDPSAPEVQELARRWRALVHAFSGGDGEIEASVGKMFQAQPEMAARQGLDQEIFRYIGEALKAES